jgi:multimeric flavodoxin WrbA
MKKMILILNGSPKAGGNTEMLIGWISEAAKKAGSEVGIVRISSLKFKACGCTSCRMCQDSDKYECAINDDARPVLAKMTEADVIVMATPLYFFSASAQLKAMVDRMFSLYKWDNETDAFTSPLKGKTLALVASAYESAGLEEIRDRHLFPGLVQAVSFIAGCNKDY